MGATLMAGAGAAAEVEAYLREIIVNWFFVVF